MTTTHPDQDIDLALDNPEPVRYIRPAQPYVIASRAAQATGLLVLAGGFWAAFTGRITLESKALPLLMAALFLCGVVAFMFSHRADQIDTPATLIDDREV